MHVATPKAWPLVSVLEQDDRTTHSMTHGWVRVRGLRPRAGPHAGSNKSKVCLPFVTQMKPVEQGDTLTPVTNVEQVDQVDKSGGPEKPWTWKVLQTTATLARPPSSGLSEAASRGVGVVQGRHEIAALEESRQMPGRVDRPNQELQERLSVPADLENHSEDPICDLPCLAGLP